MAEAQPAQPSQAPAAAPAAAPEPQGLEKVYKDFNVEGEAASFRPEPQAPQAPAQQPASAPQKFDPFDPNFPAHMQAVSQAAAQAQSALHQLQGQHTALQKQLHAQRVEADLKQAAGTLAEKSGLDAELTEVAMEARARKDPRFLQIWNNRNQNPRAFTAALDALSGELKDKFTVRQDPQLVENQRAVRASQQQMATTARVSDQDQWANLTPTERAQKRAQILKFG